MTKRKLIGKSKLSNVYDRSGVYTTDELTAFKLENKNLILTGQKHQRQDVYNETIGNADPYYNHVVAHIPGPAYDTHVLKDQSGNNFDEFIFSNSFYIETPINESGPKEYHSLFTWDQAYHVTDAATLRLGTSNFTIEFWMKTGRAIGTESYIMGKGSGAGRASGGTGWVIYLTSGNLIGFYDGLANSSTQSGTAITHDTWTHIAIVRSGGAITIYQNGVSVATGTSSGNFADTNTLVIGRDRNTSDTTYYGGYLFDLRIKSSVVYTTNFTPPTDILDMSGSVLSLSGADPWHPFQTVLQKEGLTIASWNGYTAVRKEPDHPFIVKFPRPTGSGMSCSIKPHARGYQFADKKPGKSLAFGTGAFTVECWVYVSYAGRQNQFGIAGKGTGDAAAAGATGWSFVCNGSQLQWSDGSSALVTGTVPLSANAWNHVAAVREGTGTNQFKMYVNGQVSYTGTLASNYTQTDPLVICASRNHQYQPQGNRYFGFKVSTVARYTAAFTINRSTFYDTVATNDANTLLYTIDTKNKRARPMKGQYINDGYDLISARARSTYGSLRIGSRGLYTGGHSVNNTQGDSVETLYAQTSVGSFSFGTGDFSIEFWICNQYEWENISSAGPRFLFDCRSSFNDTTGFGMRYDFRSLQVLSGGGVILADSSAYFPQRAWSHICLQRTAGNLAIYVNGNKRAETYYPGTMAAPNNKMYFMNGAYNVRNDQRWYGWMSDIRILNGSGAYSVGNSNPDRIRVPTEPLTAIFNTVLLTAGQPILRDYSGLGNLVWAGNRNDPNHTSTWDVVTSGFSPYTGQDKSANMLTDFWDGSYSGGHIEAEYNTNEWQQIESTWVMRLAKPWTIEAWFYQPQTNPSAIDTTPTWVYTSTTNNSDGWQIVTNWAAGSNSYNDITFAWRLGRLAAGANEWLNTSGGTGNINPHGWNHVAVVYDPTKATRVAMFVNGKRVATRANFTQSYSMAYYSRIQHGGYHGCGDVRISDIARYDVEQLTCTIPTAANWVRDINTAILLRMDNNFRDYSMIGNYIFDGAIRPSYQFSKWGSGSIGFGNHNSTTNYEKIYINLSGGGWSERVWDIRFGDFTVEGWAQWKDAAAGGKATPTSAPGACLFHQGNYLWVGINASGNWTILNRGGSTTNFTPTLINSVGVATSSAGTWNHWAFVRKDGDYYLYVDGLLVCRHLAANHGTYTSGGPTSSSASSNDDWYNVYDIRIGAEYNETTGTWWCGHLEDFRMTALARYQPGLVNGVWTMCHTGTNTPGLPTAPFPTR